MSSLLKSLLAILVAPVRLLFLLILFPVVIFLKMWECLLKLLKTKNLFQEETKKPCGNLPEAIIRRPDPCIYSQRLLLSQMPVTWNNPDIWIARADSPANIEPDSYHLVEDTDYIVSVRVHNASTDLALGVRVRLQYRPWSFNSPELGPVEKDASGNEVYRFVNVMPMLSTGTQFKWRTPKLQPGEQDQHFCLEASLFHPMDINTSNNLGQENTQVYARNPGHVVPGELLTFAVPLHNPARQAERFRFQATLYEVNMEEKFKLRLKATRGYERWPLSRRVANFLPTLHAHDHNRRVAERFTVGRFDFQAQPRLKLTKTKYVGFDQAKKSILSRDYSLPAEMIITAEGHTLAEEIELGPLETRAVEFTVKVPEHATPGTRLSLNIIARKANSSVAGGVTLILNIKEGEPHA